MSVLDLAADLAVEAVARIGCNCDPGVQCVWLPDGSLATIASHDSGCALLARLGGAR